MATGKNYTAWWMKNNWEKPIDDERTIVLQAMRGDDIAYEVGPYAIEFDTPEMKQTFWENGLADLVEALEAKNPGVEFYPLVQTDDNEADGEEL